MTCGEVWDIMLIFGNVQLKFGILSVATCIVISSAHWNSTLCIICRLYKKMDALRLKDCKIQAYLQCSGPLTRERCLLQHICCDVAPRFMQARLKYNVPRVPFLKMLFYDQHQILGTHLTQTDTTPY
jgi:hypothetical protein